MARSTALPFLLPFIFPLLVIAGYLNGQLWTFRTVTWLYLAGPFLDVILGEDSRNHSDEAPGIWRYLLWLWLPAQLLVVWCALRVVTHNFLAAYQWQLLFGIAVNVGMAGGMFGVTVAHELIHRGTRFERGLSDILMTLLHYPHFCIEHVYGHHRNVATPADPATARLGESLYIFLGRTFWGSLASAWRTEATRLGRKGQAIWGLRNRMVRSGLGLLSFYAFTGLIFGARGLGFIAVQGLVAIMILETINYVGHYGLTRRETSPGQYEPVSPEHAWNSNYRFTNWMLFNVARHSDHHCEAARSCLALRHRKSAPQLPAGYFAMFVLALFPPLWRRIMDPLVTGRRLSTESCAIQVSQ
jgi:alkane 1-monooxygenase